MGEGITPPWGAVNLPANPYQVAELLLRRARERFLGDVSEPEKELLRCAARGEICIAPGFSEEDDISQGHTWGAERSIRGSRLAWLCADAVAQTHVGKDGVWITGFYVSETLDLADADVPFPLDCAFCNFQEPLHLNRMRCTLLALRASHVPGIDADELQSTADVFLNNEFSATGEVRFLGARIGGQFNCTKGRFANAQGKALNCDQITVAGGVFLKDDFSATGEVRFLGANIGGQFACNKGRFANAQGHALNCDQITVAGDVFLDDEFSATGEVRFLGARIGGQFTCRKGCFVNAQGDALHCDRITVAGDVFLDDDFLAKGEVRFPGAKIGGQFACNKGRFANEQGYALTCDQITVDRDVFLKDDFSATGEVRFLGARIGGQFTCTKGRFANKQGKALGCDQITVAGGVFLDDDFLAKGEVRFPGARIGGDFACIGGSFRAGNSGNALQLERLQCGGHVFLRDGILISGELCLRHAKITRGLVLTTPDKDTFIPELDLRDAHVGSLWDEPASWKKCLTIRLQGFTYDHLDDDTPHSWEERQALFARLPKDKHSPQPYEQLARVYQEMGLEEDRKQCLIAKNDVARKHLKFGDKKWGSLSLSKWFLDYGYSRSKPLVYMAMLVMLGFYVFYLGNTAPNFAAAHQVFHPTLLGEYGCNPASICPEPPPGYTTFCPFLYALDAFVPLVDLGQWSHWGITTTLPAPAPAGAIYWFGLFVYLVDCALGLSGWVLTTIFVLGLAGLLKQ